jgi:hypothetical protein
MNGGKLTLSILTLAAFMVGAMGIISMQSAFAATSDSDTASSSVTVNGLVSITLSNTTIGFGSMDPGTSYVAANSSGLGITVDAVTNVPVNVYLSGTDFSDGSHTLTVGNLTYQVSVPSGATANTSCTSEHSCQYSGTQAFAFSDTARLGTANTASIMHWISVPSVQDPGTYTNTISIYASQV